VLLDLLDDAVGAPAVRALVVAVFDEGELGVRIALDVVLGRDGYLQGGHESLLSA